MRPWCDDQWPDDYVARNLWWSDQRREACMELVIGWIIIAALLALLIGMGYVVSK